MNSHVALLLIGLGKNTYKPFTKSKLSCCLNLMFIIFIACSLCNAAEVEKAPAVASVAEVKKEPSVAAAESENEPSVLKKRSE